MKKIFLLCTAFTLAACSEIPPQAYYNRGDPENLLDVSSEVVNVGLASPGAYARFAEMVAQDPPTRVILHCSPEMKSCANAKRRLDRQGVASEWGKGEQGASLVYQRVMARDCEQRYIDNSINPYNLPPPTFGCSLMGNTVQMVGDKRQFVNPGLLDF